MRDLPVPEGVPTRRVVIGPGGLDALPDVLGGLGLRPPMRVAIVEDAHTLAAAGERVAALLQAAGYEVQPLVMAGDEHGHVPGDRDQVDHVVDAVRSGGAGLVLSVGSGVLNDLGKLAARLADRPFVTVATAASMNGYGSPIAAIIDRGVKRTLPAAPTLAILADLDILAAAPVDMTRSGFCDLLSKASADIDWRLAHRVCDERYTPRPHELLAPIVARCRDQAGALARGEAGAFADLMHGLIYGAFAMTLAGHSAPASGGEHLISHLWDMQSHASGAPHALHGFQVALGCRLTAALHQKLLNLTDEDLDVDRLASRWLDWPRREAQLRDAHGPLFDVVVAEARAQHLDRQAWRDRIEVIRGRWSEIRETIAAHAMPPGELLRLHRAVGAPTEPEALGQTTASLRHALIHATDVRARFTSLDLGRLVGILPDCADELLEAAGFGRVDQPVE